MLLTVLNNHNKFYSLSFVFSNNWYNFSLNHAWMTEKRNLFFTSSCSNKLFLVLFVYKNEASRSLLRGIKSGIRHSPNPAFAKATANKTFYIVCIVKMPIWKHLLVKNIFTLKTSPVFVIIKARRIKAKQYTDRTKGGLPWKKKLKKASCLLCYWPW